MSIMYVLRLGLGILGGHYVKFSLQFRPKQKIWQCSLKILVQ